jgi:SpoVK/Ycf46/Vps4 family AAA+-type ATPase
VLSIPCADLVQKVVGEAERGIADIFNAARTIAPCMILLDNIDILLGASTTTTSSSDDDNDRGGGRGDTSSSRVKKERMTRDRTRHKSIDRILSTLLVEIDGLHSNGSLDLSTVIVIATTCSIDCLDRLILLLIYYH